MFDNNNATCFTKLKNYIRVILVPLVVAEMKVYFIYTLFLNSYL